MIIESGVVVGVGDVVQRGYGDRGDTAMVAWCGEGADEARLVFLVMAVGDGQWTGTAAGPGVLTYLGCLPDGDPRGEGHRWSMSADWHVVADPWWETFRALSAARAQAMADALPPIELGGWPEPAYDVHGAFDYCSGGHPGGSFVDDDQSVRCPRCSRRLDLTRCAHGLGRSYCSRCVHADQREVLRRQRAAG